jgi:hypothetical protein
MSHDHTVKCCIHGYMLKFKETQLFFCHFENILIKRFDFYEHVSTISNRYNLQPFHLLWNYESDLNLQFTK